MVLRESMSIEQFKNLYSKPSGKLYNLVQIGRFVNVNNVISHQSVNIQDRVNGILDFLVSMDPTSKLPQTTMYFGKYFQWMYNRLVNMQKLSNVKIDLLKFKLEMEYVQVYYILDLQRQNPKTSEPLGYMPQIENILDIDKLKEIVDQYKKYLPLRYTEGTDEYQLLYDNGDLIRIYEGDTWNIYIPLTEEQAKVVGQGTNWCTAYNKGNKFSINYNDAPLYVAIHTTEKEIANITIYGILKKYQFYDNVFNLTEDPTDIIERFEFSKSIESVQGDNIGNRFEILAFFDKNKEVQNYFQNLNQPLLLEKIKPIIQSKQSLKIDLYSKNIDRYRETKLYMFQCEQMGIEVKDDQILKIIKKNSQFIQNIKEPSIDVQLEQVSNPSTQADQIEKIQNNCIIYGNNLIKMIQLKQVKVDTTGLQIGYIIQYCEKTNTPLDLDVQVEQVKNIFTKYSQQIKQIIQYCEKNNIPLQLKVQIEQVRNDTRSRPSQIQDIIQYCEKTNTPLDLDVQILQVGGDRSKDQQQLKSIVEWNNMNNKPIDQQVQNAQLNNPIIAIPARTIIDSIGQFNKILKI